MVYGWNSYILTDIRAACTWAMGEILTYWLISKQPAHGRWVKFLHIYKACLHWSMGDITYWLISKQPAHDRWVKFLHINWYQSSLHMVYGWNSYILTDIRICSLHMVYGSNSYILTDIRAACTWSMGQILTYWLISEQPAHGLWVKLLHINWYQSSLHMVYGSNSYILTDIKAACTWSMGEILTY